MPEAIAHVFGYFLELCWTRRPGFAGPLSLEYQEIEAWGRLTHRRLGAFELRILLEMDVAYVKALNKKDDKASEPDISDTPLTPELFDALFMNDNRRSA